MHVVMNKENVTRGIFGAEEYESGYFSAVTETFGTTLSDQPPLPFGVDGFYEGCKLHVKRLQEAQTSLKCAAEGGNEIAMKTLKEHYRVQDLTHYSSTETVKDFYMLGLAMSKDEQLEFFRASLLLEDRRIVQDYQSRVLSADMNIQMPAPLPATLTAKVDLFEGSQLKHEIQKALQLMVLKNVTAFSYTRETFLTRLCDHPDYPVHVNLQQKVKCRKPYFYRILT
jgi:hypothetical protein